MFTFYFDKYCLVLAEDKIESVPLINLEELSPTFEEDKKGNKKFENLVYTLTATEAFNKNLVKGVIGYIEKNEGGKNTIIELSNIYETIENKESKKKQKN